MYRHTCPKRFSCLKLPERSIDKGIPGSGLLALILTDKYMDHLPLYCQKQRSLICSFYTSCGTLGSIGNEVYFPISKKELEIAIDSLYSKYPRYKIPKKWETFDSWSKRGYDFLEDKIFYFKSSPEEMYYVSFIGDSVRLADTTKIGIGVQAIYNRDYRGKWLLSNDLSSKEKQRIETRFNNEIISKLEEYTKTKILK